MIIGHQKIRERLLRSVERGACVQTYLFVGPESVGKFEVAKEFARNLMGDGTGIGKKNNQPEVDMFVLEPEREVIKGVVKEKDISVESVREALRWLGSFPYTAHKKVLIIRDAHRLTEASQNALLKTLEEPPAYAVTILTTYELGRILPTTLSRCQQIAFRLVPTEEMRDAQSFHAELLTLSPKNTFLLKLGRPGLVIKSLKQEAEFTEQLRLFERLTHLAEKPLRERLALSEACAANVPQTMQLLMWWTGGLHTRALATTSDEHALRMRSIEKIERLRNDLKRFPSSARLVLDTFFLCW